VDGIEESGGSLVMHHADGMHFLMLSQGKKQFFRVGPSRPFILQLTHPQAIEPHDVRHPFTIDTVIEDEHTAAVRERRHQGGFDGGGPRSRHHDGDVVRLSSWDKGLEQLGLDAVKQLGKFIFPMADIGLHQSLPYPFRDIHRTGIEENHSSLLPLPQGA
jgi:hypothetical protein